MNGKERDILVTLVEKVDNITSQIDEVKGDIKDIKECEIHQALLIQSNKDKIEGIDKRSTRDLKIMGIIITVIFSVITLIIKFYEGLK